METESTAAVGSALPCLGIGNQVDRRGVDVVIPSGHVGIFRGDVPHRTNPQITGVDEDIVRVHQS
jgi:hypothetical protein